MEVQSINESDNLLQNSNGHIIRLTLIIIIEGLIDTIYNCLEKFDMLLVLYYEF